MEAQIKQVQDDIAYYDREFHRQQDLASKNVASQQTFDTARRNLQNAQHKLASLNQQLAAIAWILVAYYTGRSAGFSPFEMRSV
jgi:multidrug resistance efflux pump